MNCRNTMCAWLVCAIMLLLAAPCALWAQTLAGQYIKMDMGDYWSLNGQVIHGSYMASTLKGDPLTTADDNRALISGIWVCVIGKNVRTVGDTSLGTWTKPLTVHSPPHAGLGLGKTGGYIDGQWQTDLITAGVQIQFDFRISIVRDQVRQEVTVTNLAATPQTIAFENENVTITGDDATTGTPFVPGVGCNFDGDGVERPVGMILSGSAIPKYLDTYDDVQKPCNVVRAGLGLEDATAPDYLCIGDHYADFYTQGWFPTTFIPDPTRPLNYVQYVSAWAPKTIAAKGTRKIITYCGCGAATSRWTTKVGQNVIPDYAVLAVEGPRSICYDSTTVAQNDLTPSPFTVTAYVNDLDTDPGPYALKKVTAVLYLPNGLALASGETAQKVVGPVAINSEASPVSWQVVPTGSYNGVLTYYVSASDTGGWQQTVSRDILVPATKKSVFRTGWQLMNVPFAFSNPEIDSVFGLSWGTFGARYWDPVTSPISNSYVNVTQVVPGQAFWMYVGGVTASGLPFTLNSSGDIVGATLGKQDQDQYVDVKAGWNMIGNPLVYPVYWGQVEVYDKSSNTTVFLDQAIANGWLSKTLFTWNSSKGAYDYAKTDDALIDPWKGYWLYAWQAETLIFRPAIFPGSDVTTAVSATDQ